MDRVIASIAGVLCGIGQFFVLRYTLKPLAEGKAPSLGLGLILRLLLPLALLLACALIDTALVPFAGGALCLSLVIATVINHTITLKRKDDL